MQRKWSWFERTFEFDYPVEKMPDIVERLSGTSIRIESLIENLDKQQLTWQETDSTWSIKENIGHLADLEPLWFGRIEDILSGEETMRDADLSNATTFSANHNDVGRVELIKKFANARSKLLRMIDDLEFASWSAVARHPRLKKPMRIVDLCLFVADHDDYHLARIRYLSRIVQNRTGGNGSN